VNKTADNLSLKAQEENTKVAVDQIMSEDWAGYYSHAVCLEQDYWKKDGLTEDAIGRFTIHLGENSNDDARKICHKKNNNNNNKHNYIKSKYKHLLFNHNNSINNAKNNAINNNNILYQCFLKSV
jgi:hypothetical protein